MLGIGWGVKDLYTAFSNLWGLPRTDIHALDFADFAQINSPSTGIIVRQVADWYSES